VPQNSKKKQSAKQKSAKKQAQKQETRKPSKKTCNSTKKAQIRGKTARLATLILTLRCIEPDSGLREFYGRGLSTGALHSAVHDTSSVTAPFSHICS